jgi:hypothetical protein
MQCTIIFTIFNRPECTLRVLEEIRQARPRRLLVVSDGPRSDHMRDDEQCRETRRVIEQGIDWPCDVSRDYSEANLGCAKRISSGLNWAFSLVDEAIIIEDDCLPSNSFFEFCGELLHRYRNDTRIGQICGTPLIAPVLDRDTSYIFSRYGPIWGWATWGRAWKYYDLHLKGWPAFRDRGLLWGVAGSRTEEKKRVKLYDRLSGGDLFTWDYQWGFAKLSQSMLSCIPCVNLVENIGFGADATHTASNSSKGEERYDVDFPLKHPEWILSDPEFDSRFSRFFSGGSWVNIAMRPLRAAFGYLRPKSSSRTA